MLSYLPFKKMQFHLTKNDFRQVLVDLNSWHDNKKKKRTETWLQIANRLIKNKQM